MAAVIKTVNLTKRYGTLVALSNLNLEINEGDCFGFIGPNGAGKTTTIKILATLLQPTWGEARVCDYVVGYQSRSIRPLIGYVPDYFGAYEDMVVQEYLEFFAAAYNINGQPAQQNCRGCAGIDGPGLQAGCAGGWAEPRDETAVVDRAGAGSRSEGFAAGRAGGKSGPAAQNRDARIAEGASADGQDDRDLIAHPSGAGGFVQHGGDHRTGRIALQRAGGGHRQAGEIGNGGCGRRRRGRRNRRRRCWRSIRMWMRCRPTTDSFRFRSRTACRISASSRRN